MTANTSKWAYLWALSLIWGSSFILIKKALLGVTPIQVGTLRILLAATTVLIIGWPSLKVISKTDWKWISAAGLLSSFFPPLFFALAQSEIDSGVTAIFNSLTPLNTTLVALAFFGAQMSRKQVIGVVIGLLGTWLLLATGASLRADQNYAYVGFILASSLGYALNINIIKNKLAHLGPMSITAGSFAVVVVPAAVVLLSTGFTPDLSQVVVQQSLISLLVLAVLGTALANILFNKLISLSSPVFAASVTYTIPLVALFWAWVDHEPLYPAQLAGGLIVLVGVYLTQKKPKKI